MYNPSSPFNKAIYRGPIIPFITSQAMFGSRMIVYNLDVSLDLLLEVRINAWNLVSACLSPLNTVYSGERILG